MDEVTFLPFKGLVVDIGGGVGNVTGTVSGIVFNLLLFLSLCKSFFIINTIYTRFSIQYKNYLFILCIIILVFLYICVDYHRCPC